MEKFGLDVKKRNNFRATGSSALVFFEIEEKTLLSEAAVNILFVRLGTKGGGEDVQRTATYGKKRNICMREGNIRIT